MQMFDRRSRYGMAHRRMRQRLLAEYRPGLTPCALCGQPMADPPRRLHLAHNKHGGWAGLAHATCNLREAQALGVKTKKGIDPEPRPRTRW